MQKASLHTCHMSHCWMQYVLKWHNFEQRFTGFIMSNTLPFSIVHQLCYIWKDANIIIRENMLHQEFLLGLVAFAYHLVFSLIHGSMQKRYIDIDTLHILHIIYVSIQYVSKLNDIDQEHKPLTRVLVAAKHGKRRCSPIQMHQTLCKWNQISIPREASSTSLASLEPPVPSGPLPHSKINLNIREWETIIVLRMHHNIRNAQKTATNRCKLQPKQKQWLK